MNIRENYQKELEQMKHNPDWDEKILASIGANVANDMQGFGKRIRGRQGTGFKNTGRIGIVLAVLCVLAVINFDALVSYADSIRFVFSAGNSKMFMTEVTPIEMDVQGHKSYEKYQLVDDVWAVSYPSEEVLEEYTGLVFHKNEELEFHHIFIALNMRFNRVNMHTAITYGGNEYGMNALFVIEGCTAAENGFGEFTKPYYIYEYADGRNAYFVREKGEKMQTIYFAEGGIMYQLFTENTKEGKQSAKDIVDAMTIDTDF